MDTRKLPYLTKMENFFRETWLLLHLGPVILMLLFSYLLVGTFLFYLCMGNGGDETYDKLVMLMIPMALLVLFTLAIFLPSFFFAYKKPGIKLLNVFIVLFACLLAIFVVSIITIYDANALEPQIKAFICTLSVMVFLYLIILWKIRRINKKWQAQQCCESLFINIKQEQDSEKKLQLQEKLSTNSWYKVMAEKGFFSDDEKNMPELPELTQVENYCRKGWFYLTFGPGVTATALGISLSLFLLFFSIFNTTSLFDYFFSIIMGSLVLGSLSLFILVPYFCFYRKPGTRFLTFLLFYIPISKVCSFFIIPLVGMPSEIFANSELGSAFYLATLVQETCVYFLLWKMRKINKKWQFQQLSYAGYQQAILEIEQAQNHLELQEIYAKLCKAWPAFKSVLKPFYVNRKKILNVS